MRIDNSRERHFLFIPKNNRMVRSSSFVDMISIFGIVRSNLMRDERDRMKKIHLLVTFSFSRGMRTYFVDGETIT